MDPAWASLNEAQSAHDVFAIRLADVYLIAAETQMKVGNLRAADYVNVLRTRADKAGKAGAMQITSTQLTLVLYGINAPTNWLVSQSTGWRRCTN
ncbi:RagB/SusD family nutrient uptake outer membrane protein [Spirosoma endophyticum]|uniref:SusD family protein n=1 Tax=Spirosoma endophyticum TaxID=662367 RepID=A0A1I1MVN2_9BACT|nr:RagB/SusD family nutrient uptake outer membrane protein [Spirosoma endophyticum]SFC89215.1 SusD family protein [Spirosoma endophyticum]